MRFKHFAQKSVQNIVVLAVSLPLVLPQNLRAAELLSNNDTFVDQQLARLSRGDNVDSESFTQSFSNVLKLQQGLIDPVFVKASQQNLDRSQDERLASIDRLFYSMSGSLVREDSLNKLSALMHVDPKQLLKFVDRNPAFRPQFQDLMLVLQTGTSSQGPNFNQQVFDNLKDNLSEWLDLHQNEEDQVLVGEMRKVGRYLVDESQSRIWDFNLTDSDKLLAMQDADRDWFSIVTAPLLAGQVAVPGSFINDVAGNLIPFVAETPAAKLANAKNAGKNEKGEALNEDSPVGSELEQKPESEEVAKQEAGDEKSKAAAVVDTSANGGNHWQLPQFFMPNFTPLASRPTDIFNDTNSSSSQSENHNTQNEKQDMCATFGIDCPGGGAAQGMSDGAKLAALQTSLYQQNQARATAQQARDDADRASTVLVERKKDNSVIAPIRPKDKDADDAPVDPTALTDLKHKKKKTGSLKDDDDDADAADGKANAKSDKSDKDRSPASTDAKTDPKEDVRPPLPKDAAEAKKAKPDAPADGSAVTKTKDAADSHKPTDAAKASTQAVLNAGTVAPDYEIRDAHGNCDEKSARQFLKGQYALVSRDSPGKWHSEAEYFQDLFNRRVQALSSRPVLDLAPGNSGSDKDYDELRGTALLLTQLAASDSPACLIVNGTPSKNHKLDSKACMNLNAPQMDPATSKIVKAFMTSAVDNFTRLMVHSPSIQGRMNQDCANPQSNLARSLCMNEILDHLDVDAIAFGKQTDSKSFILRQIHECNAPGQLGDLLHKREEEMRQIAKLCGSWEARVSDRLHSGKDRSQLYDLLKGQSNINSYIDAHYIDLLEEHEKKRLNIGSSSLPEFLDAFRRSDLIDLESKPATSANSPAESGSFEVYNYQNHDFMDKLNALISHSDEHFKAKLDLEKGRLGLKQAEDDQSEENRRLNLFCSEYINPRYSFLVGSLLASREVKISHNGSYSVGTQVVKTKSTRRPANVPAAPDTHEEVRRAIPVDGTPVSANP